jgi:CRISPR-associated protein Csd1
MTVLQALDRYYHRMADRGEAEAPGYSREKISFAIVLSAEGVPVQCLDLRQQSGKKLVPALIEVPAAIKRTAGIRANLFWDKSAYVLGRTVGAGRRTAEEHAAFLARHMALLANTRDEGLAALRQFLAAWTPDRFDALPFIPEMLDANLVFRLDGEHGFIHQRPAARRIVGAQSSGDGTQGFCLIDGVMAPIQRLHPTIKGVEGAQSSGAALVSFNLDAFRSYGKEQGDNAPTSQAAAFRYGAALNRMLDRGSANRVPRPIGDATVVFWADASGVGEDAAKAAEDIFNSIFAPPPEPPNPTEADLVETARLRDALAAVAAGRPVQALDPRLTDGVRFNVLGLAPNAARLSVRFWLSDSFEAFAQRLARHQADLAIEPLPWRAMPPAVQRLLVRTTALQEKFDNIPPLLAGEVTRAILSGTPYPRTLLAAAIMRLRAGDDAGTGWHAAAIRAVLARLEREETPPVSLDRDNTNPAYNLGRMFAMMEIAQRMALGRVNASIRDRYFGAASATPAAVFPLLLRGVQNHLSKLRKAGKGGWIEMEMNAIAEQLAPDLPRSLRLEDQGRFAIGYYHQRRTRVGDKPADEVAAQESLGDDNDD